MPDRETTLSDLKNLGAWHTHHYTQFHYEASETIHNALVLLREQDTVEHALEILKAHGWKNEIEPVKPISTGIEPHYNCGACKLPIIQGYPFCPWCGKAVKWDA